jgi:hypothetical protein
VTVRQPGILASRGMAERIWWLAAAASGVTFLAIGLWSRIDPVALGAPGGATFWAKPMKFALATALHFATIALAVHWLRPDWRFAPWMTALAAVSVAAAAGEIGYIAVQAARGLPSHFNVSAPGYALAWSAMAAAAVIVLAPMAVTGLLAAVDGQAHWPRAIRLAVAVGMTGGAVLTLITAFRMGANMSHFVGAMPPVDRTLPLLGWSLQGADLRPAHFLATHMAQSVPLAAILFVRSLPAAIAWQATLFLAFGWAAMTLLVFGNALSGRSLAALLGI